MFYDFMINISILHISIICLTIDRIGKYTSSVEAKSLQTNTARKYDVMVYAELLYSRIYSD